MCRFLFFLPFPCYRWFFVLYVLFRCFYVTEGSGAGWKIAVLWITPFWPRRILMFAFMTHVATDAMSEPRITLAMKRSKGENPLILVTPVLVVPSDANLPSPSRLYFSLHGYYIRTLYLHHVRMYNGCASLFLCVHPVYKKKFRALLEKDKNFSQGKLILNSHFIARESMWFFLCPLWDPIIILQLYYSFEEL